MKYMVGYQLLNDDAFTQNIIKNKEHIYEVYFSWGDFPNGRNKQTETELFLPWEAQARQIQDLNKLKDAKIPLNLLLNGNCYGKDSQSRAFFCKIGDTIDYLKETFGLNSVTTTSPLIAKFIKENFPGLEVRASVNMSIGTVEGMDYIAKYFDSYYMQREYNRSLKKIMELKDWCKMHDKKLFLLANSGCFNNCSAHTFHDNLVAHESEIEKMDNAYNFKGICLEYLEDKEKWASLVRDSNYIRPEDIHLYEGLFEAAKLATRVNKSPGRVLEAYIKGKYLGGITELLEPNHSGAIVPCILDNTAFPHDFGNHVLNCDKNCAACSYCKDVFNNALINLGKEDVYVNE
ncbi:MAG: hypothetical protein Q8882_09075 [Bacillota bacterium]|nr:hypothetical protein [Bacillota bacterium]